VQAVAEIPNISSAPVIATVRCHFGRREKSPSSHRKRGFGWVRMRW